MSEQKEEKATGIKKIARTLARHTGTTVFVVTAAVLAYGWLTADLDGANPATALVFPLVAGGFCGICAVRKWKALLVVMLAGVFVGVIGAMQLLLGPTFLGQYRIAFLTLFFYFALALIIGTLVELIRFLHKLTHRVVAG